jgi:hypothetical protein
MRLSILIAAVALVACQKESADTVAPAPVPLAPAAVETSSPQRVSVEGWQAHAAVCDLLTTPEFDLQKVGGGRLSLADLRGRWTILGFWNATLAGIEEEARYLRALNSAVDQDPDLDLLTIYLKLDGAETDVARWFANNGGDPWPTLIDTGDAFDIAVLPAYFLVGPDLTIRACRGALSSDPDGIKSVIRGVAQIRKEQP